MHMHTRTIVAALLLFAATLVGAQPVERGPRATELPFELVSAQVSDFPEPLRFGAGARAVELKQAMLVRVRVRKSAYEALPPGIDPRLYIGQREFRVFDVDDGGGNRDLLTIIYYSKDLRPPVRGAPMVITTRHGHPVHEPRSYEQRRDLPRFGQDPVR